MEFCEEENPQRGEIECTRKVLRGKEGARKKRAWSKRERYCFWTLKARWKACSRQMLEQYLLCLPIMVNREGFSAPQTQVSFLPISASFFDCFRRITVLSVKF